MWKDELFDEIQKGDKVYYENQQGQTCKGKAVIIRSLASITAVVSSMNIPLQYRSNYTGK
mgnify:CR=1 FL=1